MTGGELLITYQYDNSFEPSFLLSYQHLDTGASTTIQGDLTRQFAVLGLHYRYSNDTIMFVEVKLAPVLLAQPQFFHLTF